MAAIRWGILSTAGINRRVLPELQGLDEVELVAVGSREQQAAEAFAREFGIPRAHGSYQALLADPDIEALYIPLPNHLHVEWTLRALEAGKHVLCEKPLDRRPAEVERAFDAAERAGLHLMEGFMWRHDPQTVRAAELVAEGAVGDLRVVRAWFGFTLADADDVRAHAHLHGGSLMDVGCYCVSAARRFAGEPEVAIGRQVTGFNDIDVRFTGLLSFAGPVFAHFDCGFDVPDNAGVEVVGSEGTLRIPTPFLVTEPGLELVRDGRVERIEVERAGSYARQFQNMSAAIRGRAEPLLGRADALGQARAIEALHRSAQRGGEPVALA